jgi:hypothetical protein
MAVRAARRAAAPTPAPAAPDIPATVNPPAVTKAGRSAVVLPESTVVVPSWHGCPAQLACSATAE